MTPLYDIFSRLNLLAIRVLPWFFGVCGTLLEQTPCSKLCHGWGCVPGIWQTIRGVPQGALGVQGDRKRGVGSEAPEGLGGGVRSEGSLSEESHGGGVKLMQNPTGAFQVFSVLLSAGH